MSFLNKSAFRMTPRISSCLTIVVFFSSLAALQAGPLVIQGGSVFDSITGAMEANQTVVVEGNRIAYVGATGNYTVPQDAQVIDAQGKYIIPGLIEGHIHSHFLTTAAGVQDTDLLPLYLNAGVTTLRSGGDHIENQVANAQYCDSHPTTCPRMFLSSDLIDMDPPIHGSELGIGVSSPAQVPAIVQNMADHGATTMKIYAGTQQPVGKAVIAEGHKHGMFVTGHLAYYSAQDAVADGIDGLEHIESVFEFILNGASRDTVDLHNPVATALVNDLVEHQVMVAPTLTVFKNFLYEGDQPEIINNPDNAIVPQAMRDYWTQQVEDQGYNLSRGPIDFRRRVIEKYKELTGILYDAGVTILAGTDAPEAYCPPGLALHQELELLVESGLSEEAALQAATYNNALALMQQDNLGSIDAGKIADMVILNADPTLDIRNTRRIDFIIKDGQVVPEPDMIVLLFTGLFGLLACAWRCRRNLFHGI
jgi:hypothetical protein